MDVHTIPTHLPRNNKQINNLSQKKSIKWTRIIWKMTTNTSDLYFNWYNSYSSTDTHNTPRFFLKKTRGKGTPEDLPSFIGGTNLKRGKEREEERERKGEQVKEMSHNLIRDNWEQSREGGTSKSVLRGTEKEPHQNFTNFRVEKFKSEFSSLPHQKSWRPSIWLPHFFNGARRHMELAKASLVRFLLYSSSYGHGLLIPNGPWTHLSR